MLSSSPAANTGSLQHFIKQGCVAGAVEEPIDYTATVKRPSCVFTSTRSKFILSDRRLEQYCQTFERLDDFSR